MRAIVRTRHADPDVLAATVRPDHTDDIETAIEGDRVATTITRESAGSLHATLDDYLVNLIIADRVHERTETESMTSPEPTETDQ